MALQTNESAGLPFRRSADFFLSKREGLHHTHAHSKSDCRADRLWALEKNENAIRFYKRRGFSVAGERKPEDGTDEHLVLLART